MAVGDGVVDELGFGVCDAVCGGVCGGLVVTTGADVVGASGTVLVPWFGAGATAGGCGCPPGASGGAGLGANGGVSPGASGGAVSPGASGGAVSPGASGGVNELTGGAFGALGGTPAGSGWVPEAFGSCLSTLVLSWFTSSSRPCRRLPSLTACRALLTSFSWVWA